VPSLRFAHLSDIHLAGYEVGATFDEDADLRRELEDDLQRLVDEEGPIDLLVLGGDIAGRGRSGEFEKAAGWITDLCTALGVPDEQVCCVPGNHDVDQSVVLNDPVLNLLQRYLLDVPIAELNTELEALLTTGPRRDLLLTHLEAYNEFAARYGCDMQPDTMRWSQVRTVGPLTIKIVGVNSALLSGPHDARSAESSRLLLGPQMANLGRFKDTLGILVCHHPPAWLRDNGRVEHLIERVQLQLFGHEHSAKIEELRGGLRVHAGALHPQRSTEPWQPAYNVVALTVDDASAFPVHVDIWQRCIQPDGTFGAMDPDTPMESFTITGNASPAATVAGSPVDAPSAEAPAPTSDLQRRVARRFAALSTEARLTTGRTLGLLTDEDLELDEALRGRQVFHRARENDRLHELEEIIDE
jgi:predicted MPP superfamily phosphohydrolase